MQKITIISNRTAGRGRAERRARALEHLLREAGLSPSSHATESADEARGIARSAVAEGCECLVIAGGDGSLRNLLDLIAGTHTALAVLPTGRGNDFSRGVGLASSCARLARSIVEEQTRYVDLGCVNGTLFGTVAGCGLDAEVGRLTAGGSTWGGTAGYLTQALKSIRTFRGFSMRIQVDGIVVHEGDTTLVACANTSTYGGGFRIAPGADPTDGKLDVCVVRRVKRIEALGLLPQLALGNHLGHPSVRFFHASEVRIDSPEPLTTMADGEVIGTVPMKVTVKPQALRVVHP